MKGSGAATNATNLTIRGYGGGTDIGYPRPTPRQDGKIVTIYYFHDQPKCDGCIAATIWDA